jgi:tetratricopeptide (TPR) repeat protein
VRILERQPDMQSTLAEARNVLGGILFARDDHAGAIALFRESAADIHNREPWNAWGNLGRALVVTHAYAEAKEVLEQAVRLQPRFCLGHFWLGQARFATEDLDGAEQAFTNALEADARCGGWQEAFKLRGETRARLGHRDDAIADFERCVELGAETESGRACRRFLDPGVPGAERHPAPEQG